MEVASITASITSVIIAFLAVGLSVYFYTQAKNTEHAVSNTLASITAQTDALQRLTGRWLDRLTRYVTEPRQADEVLYLLIGAIRDIPTNVASQLQAPQSGASTQVLTGQLVTAYIALYYYLAVANVSAHGYLPASIAELQPGDFVKAIIDITYSDFLYLDKVLTSTDQSLIQASHLRDNYTEAVTTWKPLVKDTAMVYAARGSE